MDILISKEYNPYLNIAIEKHLFESFNNDLLYLWVNDPCVVIGRNQNAWLECNLEYMKDKKIHLVRRLTGGGAVYQDRGNLNYSFFTRDKDIEYLLSFVKDVLGMYGINSINSQRNDLLVDDRKFSGTAKMVDGDKHLYHGTLMVDVNYDHLINSLKPSKLKMKSHNIESVRSRVINLKEINEDITVNSMIDSFKKLPMIEKEIDLENNTQIDEYFNSMSNSKWIFDETPKFETVLEYRINNSNYQVLVDVHDGHIANAKVYTDSIDDTLSTFNTDCLDDLVFDEDMIKKVIEDNL